MISPKNQIGLLTAPGGYATDILAAVSNFSAKSICTNGLNLPAYRCPYGLPAIKEGEIAVVSSNWLETMRQQGVDIITQVLEPLRHRFNRVIGLDQGSPFLLCFSEEVVSLMDAVLKVNGVYRDLDANNYLIGAVTPDGNWTERTAPRTPPYQTRNLQKVSPIVPCFFGIIPAVRATVRRLYCRSAFQRQTRLVGDRLLARLVKPLTPKFPPLKTVHFFASLTHVQRLVTIRKIQKSTLNWTGGLTSIPSYITGLNGVGMTKLSLTEQRVLKQDLANENLLTNSLNRFQYQRTMADCKAVLSITGYGELCFRMAEAWANRRLLVCQDIAHAQTLYPFENGRNVVFCRPDLADLVEILEDIECNYGKYIPIAEQGYADWLNWSAQIDSLLQQGFAPLYH